MAAKSRKVKQEPLKEYIVRMDVTIRGCSGLVMARNEKEALDKADAFEFSDHDGVDQSTGEMMDWNATSAEVNE